MKTVYDFTFQYVRLVRYLYWRPTKWSQNFTKIIHFDLLELNLKKKRKGTNQNIFIKTDVVETIIGKIYLLNYIFMDGPVFITL